MHARKYLLLIPTLVVALLCGGCATAPKADTADVAKITLESAMAEAAAFQKAGHPEQALTALKAAAARFPADKAPWLRIAQMKFDTANYGEAIMNALEALQRDPSDNAANSIVTVSGLRLATKSLSDLRTQNALTGSVKTEAQDLAKLLRDNLGEAILVPPSVKPVVHQLVRPRLPVVVKSDKPANAVAAKSPVAEVESGKPNPFGGLK